MSTGDTIADLAADVLNEALSEYVHGPSEVEDVEALAEAGFTFLLSPVIDATEGTGLAPVLLRVALFDDFSVAVRVDNLGAAGVNIGERYRGWAAL